MSITTPVLLSLGANLGNREQTLGHAIKYLKADVFSNMTVSPWYETEPVGVENQPPFINLAVIGETTMSLEQCFWQIKHIEQRLGRVQRPRWHEREIDIDLCLFGPQQVIQAEVVVPHPHLHERKFVLVPSVDIAPEWIHPVFCVSLAMLLQCCNDNHRIQQINPVIL